MENKEDILDALNEFEKKASTEIPQVLEQYLHHVAKTGKTLFPWQQLKKLFVTKVDTVMTQFKETSPTDLLQTVPNVESVKYDDMRKRILCLMEEFQGAPFTVQRLCELLMEPKRHYKRCDKFLRGIEKNVSVVTTVDPFGRKIVSESQVMVNGLDSNGFNEAVSKPNPFSSFPTPTKSAWTANIDKWFGPSDQPKATPSSYSNTESDEREEEEDDENLTEQFLTDTNEDGEAGTSGADETPSSSEISATPGQNKIETESSDSTTTEEENTSPKDSAEEIPDVSTENPEAPSNSDESEKNTTKSEEKEPLDTPQHSESKEKVSEQSAEPCENSDSAKSQEGSSSAHFEKALDICKNAQNILDSVNKTCCDAEETVSMAQKVLESDHKKPSEDSTPQLDSDQKTVQASENTQEQSSAQPTHEQSEKESESQSKDDDTPKEEESHSSSPDKNSSTVCSQEPSSDIPSDDGSGDAVSDAKKPRLSDTCESESMEVDSSECSNSTNNAVDEGQSLSVVTEKDSEEEARLESIAEVKNQEETPMEQN